MRKDLCSILILPKGRGNNSRSLPLKEMGNKIYGLRSPISNHNTLRSQPKKLRKSPLNAFWFRFRIVANQRPPFTEVPYKFLMVNILRNITAKINSHPSLKTEKVITVSFNHNIAQNNPNPPYTSTSKAQRYQLIPQKVDSSNRKKSRAQKVPFEQIRR